MLNRGLHRAEDSPCNDLDVDNWSKLLAEEIGPPLPDPFGERKLNCSANNEGLNFNSEALPEKESSYPLNTTIMDSDNNSNTDPHDYFVINT